MESRHRIRRHRRGRLYHHKTICYIFTIYYCLDAVDRTTGGIEHAKQ